MLYHIYDGMNSNQTLKRIYVVFQIFNLFVEEEIMEVFKAATALYN